ncbi:MAG: phenylacetate-CoA oxygenase subunit PaaJ [Hydrogenophaga sp.]|uniref:1,2-phenylacetyl-CoA epoxidase subunit PaaD n=1 Tax=Hydrogenophaga sp. TaxID=1904254 RepID=UPI001BC2676B|nr:1,2-phenylacetyl-CoA epoxidase subunit PaaD [Hydrogenophaga sp.]MBS3912170.1 phenylacetate-CoA oxygenase subunit PaaJ [Hydrogenophaga sp.]MDO9149170.1 1,2-phenylacetyl-CoA epoxidase subunit PaaD [Hydrogenophaga sp.]MDO9606410.1 1,2-phenylacetyl-CoA epoxidase subunit PaaD [Hydrogenophaga sp.]MDP2164467.1 1,2-phenylacetyl-CoA epoxidase subunit PaaD [Hydrogenophaga sp.]MDP3475126.1 1,2-phenylacetyl-CoA epoxidase subunit PaaD [Hydrogenophaga sp.]
MGVATDASLQAIAQALAHLADPEIPVISLTELGILREVRAGADGTPEVVITPTYSGCPAMGQIEDDIVAALREAGLPGRVVTQLSPAWTTDWMTDAAREKLRAYGIAPPRCTQAAPAGVMRFSRQAVTAEAIACPQCGSLNTTETSPFGSTACKALYRCLDCLEPFDYFKPI